MLDAPKSLRNDEVSFIYIFYEVGEQTSNKPDGKQQLRISQVRCRPLR